jgi:hypothetical protein
VRLSSRFLFVILTFSSGSCEGPKAHRTSEPQLLPVRDVSGDHAAAADCTRGPALLALRAGVSVAVCHADGAGGASGTAQLAVASRRKDGASPGTAFIPVGPRFTLVAEERVLSVRFRAEHYQVRNGYRPTLAAWTSGSVQLQSADFRAGHFTAAIEPRSDSEFRFGLVPVTQGDDGGARRIEAP